MSALVLHLGKLGNTRNFFQVFGGPPDEGHLRSSPPEITWRKAFFERFADSIGNDLRWSTFLNQ